MSPLTLSLPRVTLIDFTLSNARRFYSSMGNPTGVKGLRTCFHVPGKSLPSTQATNRVRLYEYTGLIIIIFTILYDFVGSIMQFQTFFTVTQHTTGEGP